MPLLVLASESPRRQALLARLGLPFDVVPSGVDEVIEPDEPASAAVARLALVKARAVAARAGPAVVLAADTLVVVDGRPLGKPRDRAEARAMLEALRDRAHEVVTGVAVVDGGTGRTATAVDVTRVVMRPYSPAEIDAYLRTDEPYDKAGAYAVQGEGGRLVARVEGSYTNVVGLPLRATARLLCVFGLPVTELDDPDGPDAAAGPAAATAGSPTPVRAEAGLAPGGPGPPPRTGAR